MIGTIAPNLHEGTRSEYLAQYIFSAFGTSIPVPHPEDSGIDLHCTLGERIGQRLFIQNYYFVQVKSKKEKVVYEGKKTVKWLVSQRYPLFLCYVNKKENIVEIYQTLLLAHCFGKNFINSITLVPELTEKPFEPIKNENEKDVRLYLEEPIIRFNITQMAEKNKVKLFKNIVKEWIELDQSNIDRKFMGFSMINVPVKHETNSLIKPALKWLGMPAPIQDSEQEKFFYDNFLTLLSQWFYQTIFINDINRFNVLDDFTFKLINSQSLPDSWGVRLVVSARNTAGKHFNPNAPQLILQNKKEGIINTPLLNLQTTTRNE